MVVIDDAVSQQPFTIGDLFTGISTQFPLMNLSNAEGVITKMELWGPTSGIASMTTYMVQPYITSQSTPILSPIRRTTRVDTGTTARRAFVSYEWPSESTSKSTYLITETNTHVVAYISLSSGATSFGTYGILYVHFELFNSVSPPIPALHWSVMKKKRKAEDIDREQDLLVKCARIKNTTIPQQLQE